MRLATILLTVPVVALLTQPLWAPQWGAGILGEVALLGPVGAVAAIAVFFGLVALYCATLHRLMSRLPQAARAATPRSVWLMFAIPFNFVEDFFIVRAVGSSLGRSGLLTRRTVAVWSVLGFVWCALQIGSLLPGDVGFAAGAAALLAWVAHWIMSGLLSRRLRTPGLQ